MGYLTPDRIIELSCQERENNLSGRRMIDSSYWTSETIAALTIQQRLLFLGLVSNADDQGRLKGNPALVRSIVFPLDDISLETIQADLEAIAAIDSILLYEQDAKQYIQVTGWWKYQFPQWAYPSKIPAPEGWSDRLRYKQGNQLIEVNWKPEGKGKGTPGPSSDGLSEASDKTPGEASGKASGETPAISPMGALPEALAEPSASPIELDLEIDQEIEIEKNNDAATLQPSADTLSPAECGVTAAPPSSSLKHSNVPTFKRSNVQISPPANLLTESSNPPTQLTTGQSAILQAFGARRFKTQIQRDTVLTLEQRYGHDLLGEAITWAAKKGMSLSQAVQAIETALPKWGQAKNNSSQDGQENRRGEKSIGTRSGQPLWTPEGQAVDAERSRAMRLNAEPIQCKTIFGGEHHGTN